MPSLPNLDLQKSGDGVSSTAKKQIIKYKYTVYIELDFQRSDAHPPAAPLCSVSSWSRRASPRALRMKWDLRPVGWCVSGPKRSWVASLTTWRTWPASCSIATTLVQSPWLHSLLWPEHPQVKTSSVMPPLSLKNVICCFVLHDNLCVIDISC